jgi:hypothetical protein
VAVERPAAGLSSCLYRWEAHGPAIARCATPGHRPPLAHSSFSSFYSSCTWTIWWNGFALFSFVTCREAVNQAGQWGTMCGDGLWKKRRGRRRWCLGEAFLDLFWVFAWISHLHIGSQEWQQPVKHQEESRWWPASRRVVLLADFTFLWSCIKFENITFSFCIFCCRGSQKTSGERQRQEVMAVQICTRYASLFLEVS